jgi:hypothetical protein
MTQRDRQVREPEERSDSAGRVAEPSPPHARADDAADIAGKDEVQIGSEASFPASDPPSWMSIARPGGRGHAPEDYKRPHIPVEPPRHPPREAGEQAD